MCILYICRLLICMVKHMSKHLLISIGYIFKHHYLIIITFFHSRYVRLILVTRNTKAHIFLRSQCHSETLVENSVND